MTSLLSCFVATLALGADPSGDQILPSPTSSCPQADVQYYFPRGPQFRLSKEAASNPSLSKTAYAAPAPNAVPAPPPPSCLSDPTGNPQVAPQEGTCEAMEEDAECSPPTPFAAPVAQCPNACPLPSAPAQPTVRTISPPMAPRCPIAAPAAPYSGYPTTNPYVPLGAAPAAPSNGYVSFNNGLSPVTGGVAKNPAFGAAITVSDVIAMTRAKVDNEVIVGQYYNHGLAAPLRPADVITLSQNGVSTEVIITLQTAVAKEELGNPSPYHAAPAVMNSSYETSPSTAPPVPVPAKLIERSLSPRAGSIPPATSGDPQGRPQEVIYTSENLRLLQDELERSRWLEGSGNATRAKEKQLKNDAPEATSKEAKGIAK